ncbi:hypothetical protein [Magnetospirillum sulfuroxidans]|uniref:Secreted protein n=1 Tax=Magnetospirillum sulfuroxidans TaxID=611300 RepID=A0ABS5IER7_9PROT|nr:hypothetical protein [Magnetospirillum sulfuroxidans]MBR9972907.1 hypothetical protein [Magnetospirillum sulfuroxidans]
MRKTFMAMAAGLIMTPLSGLAADDVSRNLARGLERDLLIHSEEVLTTFVRQGTASDRAVRKSAQLYMTTKLQIESLQGQGAGDDSPAYYSEVPVYLLLKACGFAYSDLQNPFGALAGVEYWLPSETGPTNFFQSRR